MEVCHLYSYEGKNWDPVVSIQTLQNDDWLFYLDDMYFGQIMSKSQQSITLVITNFRTSGAHYQASFQQEQWPRLRLKPVDVLVDPQIQASHPTLHKSLQKAFAIWQNLDGLVMEAKTQNIPRQESTPQVFQEFGRMFGKWAASGYMKQQDICYMQENDFVKKMQPWRSLEEIAMDENIEEELLVALDTLRNKKQMEAKNLGLSVADHLCLQAGFFENTIENVKRHISAVV